MALSLVVITAFFFALPLSAQIGVVSHDRQRTDDCYRLVSSRNLEAAHLITPEGRYVHSWYYPHTDNKTSDFGGFGMTWHYAEMLRNGNLLAIIKDEMIIELNWDSRLVWKAKLRAHHDFARTEDGHTIVVSRRDQPNPWKSGETLAVDELVEFDREGTVVWKWQYEEHIDEIERFVKQPLPAHSRFRDWPHINTCEVIPHNPTADRDARFKAGNLLLCGRHANTIFIVDKAKGEVVWAWGPGELEGPHMPTMLPNGHLLVYDNGQHLEETARGYSRVIELDPVSENIVWTYTADPPESFYSPSRGSAERLRNGNTLIAESDSGRLFEVTPDGDIVWEYWNADRTERGDRMAFYRTVPYDKEVVESLLDRYGRIKDVDPDHLETLTFRELDPKDQYKQYIREVVFWVEIGYFDHALHFLEEFMKVFPDDPEGFFGYTVVFAAKKDPSRAFDFMQKTLKAGLPLGRFSAGLNGLLLTQSESFRDFVKSVDHVLIHGPMLGNVTDHSAAIWVRTFGPRAVSVLARPLGSQNFYIRTPEMMTVPERERTAVLILGGLAPETVYEYHLQIDGQVLGSLHRLKTFPENGHPSKFFTGFGGGAGYTPWHEHMWDLLRSFEMPFFLLLGDNVYIDHPERPAVQKYCYYRRQSCLDFRGFAEGTALYAIWDDHDFTHDDGKGSPQRDSPAWKLDVWRIFRNQWNNPFYGGGEEIPGCWTRFSYGDVDFFLLDGRYYREDPVGNPTASMLGKEQKAWLFEGLRASKATFKVIASPVPWACNTKPGSLDTWDGHPEEREEIFRFIEKNRIEGVILLSADRHRSDAWRIRRPNGYDLLDLMSSKLTNVHTHPLLPGALFGYNKTCSVGLLEFDTIRNDPQVIYRIVNIENEEIHRMTIYRSQLTFKD